MAAARLRVLWSTAISSPAGEAAAADGAHLSANATVESAIYVLEDVL